MESTHSHYQSKSVRNAAKKIIERNIAHTKHRNGHWLKSSYILYYYHN